MFIGFIGLVQWVIVTPECYAMHDTWRSGSGFSGLFVGDDCINDLLRGAAMNPCIDLCVDTAVEDGKVMATRCHSSSGVD